MLVIEEGGKRRPLLDGHTGEIHVFSKREVFAWQYGVRGTGLGNVLAFLEDIG